MDNQINFTVAGENINIREGKAPEIFQYQGFRYEAQSTDSLISLVKAKGSKAYSVIGYTKKQVVVIVDDMIKDRPQDIIAYPYQYSQQYLEWSRILNGAKLTQKEFVDFLKRRELDEVYNLDELLASIQKFRFVTNISGDFVYDDNNNYTFAIKVGDAEGTMRLPTSIAAVIEIFNESDFRQDINIELEIEKPKSQDDKLMFHLSCPTLQRYLDEAVEREIFKIKTQLDGYLIVAGDLKTNPQT